MMAGIAGAPTGYGDILGTAHTQRIGGTWKTHAVHTTFSRPRQRKRDGCYWGSVGAADAHHDATPFSSMLE